MKTYIRQKSHANHTFDANDGSIKGKGLGDYDIPKVAGTPGSYREAGMSNAPIGEVGAPIDASYKYRVDSETAGRGKTNKVRPHNTSEGRDILDGIQSKDSYHDEEMGGSINGMNPSMPGLEPLPKASASSNAPAPRGPVSRQTRVKRAFKSAWRVVVSSIREPKKSGFFKMWDPLTLVLLLFTATVTPFEAGFLETQLWEPLFFINRIVDIVFFVDLCFNFMRPIQTAEEGIWIYDLNAIAHRYLRSWFAIDSLSVIPFDVITMLGVGGGGLQVLRTIRLMRLAKLLRVLRAGRMFRRWESSIAVDYMVVHLVKFLAIVLAVSHWLACFWGLLAEYALNEDSNWIEGYPYLTMEESVWSKYIASLHWSVATLSTVGYGDIIPVSDIERAYVVFCTVLGASIYAYVVGNVCGIVSQMDEQNAQFYVLMDTLNRFMEEKALPRELRRSLRDFFRFRRHNSNIADWNGLIAQMSPGLRVEVSRCVHAKHIQLVACFRGFRQEVLTEIAMCLVTATYGRDEAIFKRGEYADQLYILEKGLVFVNERIITRGKTFGEDMVFREKKRAYGACTVTHTVTLALSRSNLVRCLAPYPKEARMMRRYAVRVIFRENILTFVKAAKRIEEKNARKVLPSDFGKTLTTSALDFYSEKPAVISPAQLEAGAVVIQAATRRWLRRKRTVALMSIAREHQASQSRLVTLLAKLNMRKYAKPMIEQELDFNRLQKVSPEGLHSIVGMPLGRAVLLLEMLANEVDRDMLDRDMASKTVQAQEIEASMGSSKGLVASPTIGGQRGRLSVGSRRSVGLS